MSLKLCTEYYKDNILVISSTFLVLISGYLFHFIAAKRLGPSEYGLVVSLLAIVYLANIFLQSSQTTIASKIAETKSKKIKTSQIVRSFLDKNLRYGILAILVFLLSIPLFARFLNTTDYMAISILSILIFSSFLLPVTRGFLQGTQQFSRLAATYLAEGATKLLALYALFSLSATVTSAMISITLSYLIPLILTIPILPAREHTKFKIDYRLINDITLLLTGLALYYSIDVILVKHFFSAYDAGLYSAASLYGKIIIFSAIPIAMVLLPKVIESHTKNKNPFVIFKKSLMLLALICIPLLAAYLAIPERIIMLSLGKGYMGASPLIIYYGIASCLISIAYIESFYIMGLKKEKKLWIPVTLLWLIEPLLITLNHNSLYIALIALLVSSGVTVLFLSMYIRKLNLLKRPHYAN